MIRFTCICTEPTRRLPSNRYYWLDNTKHKTLPEGEYKPFSVEEDFKAAGDSYIDFFKHLDNVLVILKSKPELFLLDRPVSTAYFISKFMKEE